MPSFGGIKRDCDTIMVELKTKLKAKLSNSDSSPAEMSECVGLLLQLDEPSESLCQVFLETSGRRLGDSLVVLEKQVYLASAGGLPVKSQQVVLFLLYSFYLLGNLGFSYLETVDQYWSQVCGNGKLFGISFLVQLLL